MTGKHVQECLLWLEYTDPNLVLITNVFKVLFQTGLIFIHGCYVELLFSYLFLFGSLHLVCQKDWQ